MGNWKSPPETPDQDWDYENENTDVSVRVIVNWMWENDKSKRIMEPRFARYFWYDHYPKGGIWVIEGVTGNTIVLEWLDLNKVK